MRPRIIRVPGRFAPNGVSLLLCVFCAMVLAACWSGSGLDRPPADTIRRGGVLRMVQQSPKSLDPLVGDSVYESLPLNQIFDTVVDFDSSMNLIPGLAETWTISRDGILYTFRLREGVRFHDGQELTAEDVRFTLLRNLAPEAPARSLAHAALLVIEGAPEFAAGRRDDLPGLRVLDARTIEIRLAKPYISFLEVLAMDALSVVPERAVRAVGDEAFGRAPIGTGPFRFEEWTDERLRLASAGEHFGGAPLLDAVEILFLREDESDYGEARLVAGEVDVLEPSSVSLARLDENPAVRLRRYQELSLSFLGLNTSQAPLDQVWVRQAIAHALDREGMVEDSPTVRRQAAGILPPGLPGYSPELKGLPFDPARARSLLAEHGHPGGAGLAPIRLAMPSTGSAAERVLERIRTDLANVGLRLEVVPVTWADLSEQLEARSAPAFLLAWVADRTDPDAFLRSLFAERGSANYFAYANAGIDALLDSGSVERNPQERSRIYRDLERQILADAPIVPLYHTVGITAIREHVRGLEPTPLGLAKAGLAKVWLVEGGAGS